MWLWLIVGTSLMACSQSQQTNEQDQTPPPAPVVNLDDEIAELLKLQAREQEAHLSEQPALLVNMLNDTLCQIKNGEVKYFSKDDMTDRLVKYFYSVEFVKWDDIKPPVITLSPDGTMAHILVQKEVEVILADRDKPTRERTEFAWTELWKKNPDASGGRWKLYSVTTTDKGNLVRE